MKNPHQNNPPIVFISYAHEGDLGEKVAALSEWLLNKGVQVITDHPYKNRPPEEGWRAWMQHNIEDCDLVLIVCSKRYKDLFEKRPVTDRGGHGVSWESAIITSEIYWSRMYNRRFYPILPDGGDLCHVPAILKDWYNGHRFPSGNERILSLIRDEIKVPVPKKPFQQLLPGEISGSNDPRILPREGEVIGREKEVAEVLAFLAGSDRIAAVCCHVTGSGGIGKTEVCKEALRRWLGSNNADRTFWIPVVDDADVMRLIGQLGEAIGLTTETIAGLKDVSQIRPYLPKALYYLDNLESVAESPGGINFLRMLSQMPGIRLLASSRVPLDGVLGRSLFVGPLDPDSAVRLSRKCWTGGDLPDSGELGKFLITQLGGHALTIVLLARLGRAYGWRTLRKKWGEKGTALAKTRRPGGRLDSLDISLSMTTELLQDSPGALDLWQFSALFPDGLDEETLELWCEVSGYSQAHVPLADHHLLSIDDQITMLPPMARYALDNVGRDDGSDKGFNWTRARRHAYDYFLKLSHHASDIASSEEAVKARSRTSRQLWAIEQLFKTDMGSGDPDKERIRLLHRLLLNVYGFNVLAGRAALTHVHRMLGDAMSQKILGDLESRLGNVDQARVHYENAIELYKKEQVKLGLANVYQSMGDLFLAEKSVEDALQFYQEAISLYKSEQEPMGIAYTLSEIIRCHHRLGSLDLDGLRHLAMEALMHAVRSGVESVAHYVLSVLNEYFDGDEKELREFIKSLELEK